ncbi:MAG: isocitrate lyase/phosphoenolpyruvate mutase family protein [Planctomycetota bacterium]|nr:isocitrate lyase/phosphoenolpyruvate mutase family protein [Planctomycetota bacterium]
MSQHPARQLRDAMEEGTVSCPGAFTALVARAVCRAGFKAVYVSGGATANTAGVPDIGLLSLQDFTRTIQRVAEASQLPVIADADTGFGDLDMVSRTVVEYDQAGAAGLHIEDQVFPKRCGHLDGKEVVSTSEMVEKVRAAAAAKLDPEFLLIARTDARSVEGLDEAIERGNAYRQAGADMIFPEGLESEEEFNAFADGCPGLLMANMTEFGRTPIIPVNRFAEMNYQLVIHPVTTQRVAMNAVVSALKHLHDNGSVEGILGSMQTRDELYDLLDYVPSEPWGSSGEG